MAPSRCDMYAKTAESCTVASSTDSDRMVEQVQSSHRKPSVRLRRGFQILEDSFGSKLIGNGPSGRIRLLGITERGRHDGGIAVSTDLSLVIPSPADHFDTDPVLHTSVFRQSSKHTARACHG